MDDLMDEGGNDKRVLDLFTKHSHHQNLTVLFLCQDIFPNGRHAKTISRNAHYVVAFKNPRDQVGFRNLALQCFPTKHKAVQERYQSVTSAPFGYMALDFHPASQRRRQTTSESFTEGRRLHALLPFHRRWKRINTPTISGICSI